MKEDLEHYAKQKGVLPPPPRQQQGPMLKDKRSKSRIPANANMTTPKKGQPRDGSQDPTSAVFNFNALDISGLNESMLGDISPSDIYSAVNAPSSRQCLPFMAEQEDKGV
jgi:hypothetical protein